MARISFLMLTIDRFEITRDVLENNLSNGRDFGPPFDPAKFGIELLVADNGSADRRVVDYIAKHPLTLHHRVNARNEGVGKAFNQLFLRAQGDYIVLLGNDIKLPPGWLYEAIRYLDAVPKAGIAGIDWGHGSVPPLSTRNGIHAHYLTEKLNRVFGVWVMKRELVDHIGLFHEGFHEYGLEDSDFNERVNRSGHVSFYLPHMKSQHLCHDVGQDSEYRRAKDRSMGLNLEIFSQRVKAFDQGASLREPLPYLRGELV